MADFQSLAAVGRSIQRFLNLHFEQQEPVPGKNTKAVVVRTEDLQTNAASTAIGSPALSIFLYRVDYNRVMRAAWSAVGSQDGHAHLPLDLHFLLTPWAENADYEHRILGRAMQCLEVTPILSGPLLDPLANWAVHEVVQVSLTELTTEEVMRVIDQIAEVGKVPSVSFTGGECTLRPELAQFVARARSHGMRVNIITNGLLCASRRYVDTLAAAGLTSAQVSLEGPTAEVHEKLTQRPGSFGKTVRGIENLRAAGLHVHTNTTICEENADHVTGIVDLARALGLPHVSMNHIIPTGTPNLARHQHTKVSYMKIGHHVMRAKCHAERVGIDFHWYSPTPFCIFNPIAHGLGNQGCAACDGLLHVSPSGEVLPCSSFARGVGSLLDDGFENVWFGKDAQYYKQKRQAHPICQRCEHFKLCQGACTLYWSSMGYGELYEAKRKRQDLAGVAPGVTRE